MLALHNWRLSILIRLLGSMLACIADAKQLDGLRGLPQACWHPEVDCAVCECDADDAACTSNCYCDEVSDSSVQGHVADNMAVLPLSLLASSASLALPGLIQPSLGSFTPQTTEDGICLCHESLMAMHVKMAISLSC